MGISKEEAAFPAGAGHQLIESQALSGLSHLAHLGLEVLSLGLEAGLGWLLGRALARAVVPVMHERGLRWSWAGMLIPPTLLMHLALGRAALPLAVAEAAIARQGRRRHMQDLADVHTAGEARERRGPVQAGMALVARARARRELAAGRIWGRGGLLIGHEPSGAPVEIPLGGTSGGRHTLVLGATGSGKTVTISRIAAGAVAGGMATVVIDPKGDPSLRESLRGAAQEAGREMIEWSPEGPWVYNPLARGSASEIADKALAGEVFSEPHYQRQAQRYLGQEVRALRAAGVEVSLEAIVRHLDPGELELLLRGLPEEEARAGLLYLDSLSERQARDLTGVRDRLAILAESDVGPWLDPSIGMGPRFDLLQAIRERIPVFFSVEADRWVLLSRMLGAAILQDLLTAMADLQREPVPVLLVVEEFAAIQPKEIVRLFARGRSGGLSALLATQELGDMSGVDGVSLREQILGNLSLLIAHRQVLPESARIISGLAGSRTGWSTSLSSTGARTHRRAPEPVLAVESLRRLKPGEAAILDLAGGGGARIARIAPPAPSRAAGARAGRPS